MVQVGIRPETPEEARTGLLAIGFYDGEKPPGNFEEASRAAIESGDFSGKEATTALLYAGQSVAADRLLLVGLGKKEKFTLDKLRRAAATAAKKARSLKLDEAVFVPRLPEGTTAEGAAQAAAEGAALGLYRFTRYKTGGSAGTGGDGSADSTVDSDGSNTPELGRFDLAALSSEAADGEAMARGASSGTSIAAAALLARDLANEPGSTATPEYLAGKAREISSRYNMAFTVLDRAGIEEEGLTGLATVGRSSAEEPQFIVLEHRGGGDEAPVVLVGKAVTFDSGGISIKPSGGMEEMKFDMSGGAAVLGAMEAVGAMDLPLNVVALVPATENLPGGSAFKPGDVLTMHSGKTVEIITTDAEGRLILADALSYARRYDPAAVIDCATLTGACVIALGKGASGLMGNDDDLIAEVQTAGEATGERAWPLPLFDDYTEQIKGETADIKNAGGRGAGALTAGAFLKEFADFPWAHLDIAGTAWGASKNSYTPKGATGAPARLLVEFLRARAESQEAR